MTDPEILGRQPVLAYITPSRPNPWYGTIVGGVAGKIAITGGERFTTQQVIALRTLKRDPATAEAVTVSRAATTRELWWAKGSPAPHFQFDCPVLARHRDGRIGIVSPAGLTEVVSAEGWAGRAPAVPKGRGR